MANLKNARISMWYCAALLAGAIVLGSCTVNVNDDNGPVWGTLSQETFDQLMQDLVEWDYPHRIPPIRYLGTHNDFVVFYFAITAGGVISRVFYIGGVGFMNLWGGLPIYLWKDGRIYSINGHRIDPCAYEKGFLTREDLESLANTWRTRPNQGR